MQVTNASETLDLKFARCYLLNAK